MLVVHKDAMPAIQNLFTNQLRHAFSADWELLYAPTSMYEQIAKGAGPKAVQALAGRDLPPDPRGFRYTLSWILRTLPAPSWSPI